MRTLVLLCAILTGAVWGTPTVSPYADITLDTYWDNATQSMQPQDLVKVSKDAHVSAFHLAFLTDGGHCEPAWGGQVSYPIDFAKTLTDKMKQAKIEYSVSFGGANGNDLSLNCDAKQLNAIFENTHQLLKTNAFDFDIENGTANIETLMSAIQTYQGSHPKTKIQFTLPTMPEGLTETGKSIIKVAKNKGIRFTVNVMAMDYGPAYPADMADYAKSAANALFSFLKAIYTSKSDKQLWEMVGITPMIGVNDVSVEHFTLVNAKSLQQFANKKQIGLLSFWSISRDKPCPDKWASPICSGLNLQAHEYEYTNTFNAALKIHN